MSDLLVRQFVARYGSRISREISVAAGTRTDRFHPEPTPNEWAKCLERWGAGFRVLVLGHPERWPTGWTASIPIEEVHMAQLPSGVGRMQTIGRKGSRFEHRIYDPVEFNRIASQL